MSLADRIKLARTNAGLSQSELAERMCVSRQAVSKWESGRGTPDIENLKNLAGFLGVSVDFLVGDASAALTGVTTRTPVELGALSPYRSPGKPLGSRYHAAVKLAFPRATTIWPLSRVKRNSRVQEAIEWLLLIVFDVPPGTFGTADALNDRAVCYLVEEENRFVLARVSRSAVEGRELAKAPAGNKFAIGDDIFRRLGCL